MTLQAITEDPKAPKPIINRVIGALLMLCSVAMYSLPMFIEVKKDFTDHWYVPLIPLAVGTLLFFRLNLFITTSTSVIEKITHAEIPEENNEDSK